MKLPILFILFLYAVVIRAQNVGINNANLAPDPSAGLDINYTDKGLLIPRVSLTGTNDVITVPGAATSLLVYNTATISDVTPGYYYWTGSQWVRLLNTGNAGGMEWLLNGNAGTTAGTNFLGTTDSQDLVFKTNNIENMRISNTTGNVGIGTNAPSELLELQGGGLQLNDSMGIAFNGDLPFNTNTITDAARIYYENSSPLSWTNNPNNDFLIIEKTDGNDPDPDGGIAFINKGNDNIQEVDMIIRGNGNIGIGTTNPSTKLQIVDGNVSIKAGATLPNDPGDLIFIDNSGAQKARIWAETTTNTGLHLNGNNTTVPDITISNTGNVGIGITNPTEKLEVYTTNPKTEIRVSSNLSASSNATVAFSWEDKQSGGIWRAYYGGPAGYSGVQPRAWELWEYPNDGSSGSLCCRPRLRILSSYGLGTTYRTVTITHDGQIQAYGFVNVSDKKLKENIKPINTGLDAVLKLTPKTYVYKGDTAYKYGFLANEVKEILPYSVAKVLVNDEADHTKTNEFLGVDYTSIIPVLTKAIQEQQQIISKNSQNNDELNSKIKQLQIENQELKKQLEEIKKLILEK
jgi:hypothetical protein